MNARKQPTPERLGGMILTLTFDWCKGIRWDLPKMIAGIGRNDRASFPLSKSTNFWSQSSRCIYGDSASKRCYRF